MALIPHQEPGGHELLLEQMAQLHLLMSAFERRATLDDDELADLREQIGFTVSKRALLSQPGLRDQWWVMAHSSERTDDLHAQRTWLWGARSARGCR